MFLVLTVLTGGLYPAIVTGVAQVLFPSQANGSFVTRDGKTVGSTLIGQQFDQARYLWGRPSATSPTPYAAAASAGSNLGPLSDALAERVRIDVARMAVDGAGPVPADLVTTSASGLDPEISPAAARWQVARLARARSIPTAAVLRVIAGCTRERQLGVLGEPGVNVLCVNVALDAPPAAM